MWFLIFYRGYQVIFFVEYDKVLIIEWEIYFREVNIEVKNRFGIF